MASVNKVILVGHLGSDPNMSNMPSGSLVAELSLATSESWKDKNSGEYKSVTEWHRIKILNERLAAFAKEYLRKGSRIYVEGKLQYSQWTDKDGKEHKKTEIVLTAYKGEIVILDSKKESEVRVTHGETQQRDLTQYGIAQPEAQPKEKYSYSNLEDEVPF